MDGPTLTVGSRIAGTIEIEGKTYQIRKLDGRGWEKLQAARARIRSGNAEQSIEDAFSLASRLVVGLTPEQLLGTDAEFGLLDRETALAIVQLAGRSIEAVEEELGKERAAPAPAT